MSDGPSSQRRTKEMPEPEKAKTKPKRITTKNPPGGPHTPGAKEEAKKPKK